MKAVSYIGIAILVAAIAVIVIYLASSSHPHTSPSPPSNSLSNETTPPDTPSAIFLNDVSKLSQAKALYVAYFAGNSTQTLLAGNSMLSISGSQFISSYKLGQDLRSIVIQSETETNLTSGRVLNSTASTLLYYNTPYNEVTCLNQTSRSAGNKTNSSLQCYRGNGSLTQLSSFPFNLSDTSSLSNLLIGSNISYIGPRTGVEGRPCDLFAISTNQTGKNFTSINICLDTKYGVPLYINSTAVTHDLLSGTNLLVALNVSSNVTVNDFSIPPAYLNQTYIT